MVRHSNASNTLEIQSKPLSSASRLRRRSLLGVFIATGLQIVPKHVLNPWYINSPAVTDSRLKLKLLGSPDRSPIEYFGRLGIYNIHRIFFNQTTCCHRKTHQSPPLNAFGSCPCRVKWWFSHCWQDFLIRRFDPNKVTPLQALTTRKALKVKPATNTLLAFPINFPSNIFRILILKLLSSNIN